MTPLILALPGGERLAGRLHRELRGAPGALTIYHPTNRIDVTGAIRRAVAHQLQLDVRHALTPSGER